MRKDTKYWRHKSFFFIIHLDYSYLYNCCGYRTELRALSDTFSMKILSRIVEKHIKQMIAILDNFIILSKNSTVLGREKKTSFVNITVDHRSKTREIIYHVQISLRTKFHLWFSTVNSYQSQITIQLLLSRSTP